MKSRILVVVTGILIVIGSGLKAEDKIVRHGVSTVSYTHLTLPTILLV